MKQVTSHFTDTTLLLKNHSAGMLKNRLQHIKTLSEVKDVISHYLKQTLNTLKLKIMVRAFKIRIKNGEAFEDIAADYPALTTDDLEAIREALNVS